MPLFTLQRFITTTINSAGSCAHHTISGAGSLYFPGCHSFPFSAACKTPSSLADLVPIFMIQRCLHFVDTFEALIYYIRWYKLKKGGPTLSVDSPNIDQHKKSALLCSKALSGAPSGTLPRSKNAPLGRFCPPDRRRARAVLVTRWCTRLNRL